MRKTNVRRVVSILLMVITAGPYAAAADVQGARGTLSDKEVAAILQIIRSYPRAWIADDKDAILSHFWPDAVLMPHHGVQPVEGIAAIQDFWWPEGGPPSGVTEFTIEPAEVSGEDGLAYVRSRFSLSYWFGPEQERRYLSNEGNRLDILKRGPAGHWRIFRAIWNDPVAEVVPAGTE